MQTLGLLCTGGKVLQKLRFADTSHAAGANVSWKPCKIESSLHTGGSDQDALGTSVSGGASDALGETLASGVVEFPPVLGLYILQTKAQGA